MTKIEWTDCTWNPTTGCTKISSGCKNCYAARMANRLRGRFGYPADDPFRVTLRPDRLELPFKWRNPRRVFVDSMGDLFHEAVPFDFIAAVFGVMAANPQHTFQILTKRPNRMLEWYSWISPEMDLLNQIAEWPIFPNVWLGVTAENQKAADERIPTLLQCPAAVRFVSAEPLLGPLNLRRFFLDDDGLDLEGGWPQFAGLDWVIVGGETGPGARPMNPDWARQIRDQCKEVGVPFFFKKMGQGKETPSDLMIREFPK